MKKILVCLLVIAMMLPSVIFAHESICIDFADYDEEITDTFINISVENHLKIDGNGGNNEKSKFEIADDPVGTYGKVLKLTNPIKSDITVTSPTFPYINPTFYGTDIKKINFGFSVYVEDNSSTSDKEMEMSISVKFKTASNTNGSLTVCKINSEKLFSNAGYEYSEKFAGKWFDLRFDIDGINKVVTIYIDGEYFDESYFEDDVNYIQRMNIATTVNANSDTEQVAYFDNFFVNKAPVSFDNRSAKIDYSTRYVDDNFNYDKYENDKFVNDDTTDGPTAPVDNVKANNGGWNFVDLSDKSSAGDKAHGKCVQLVIPKNTTGAVSSPSMSTQSIYKVEATTYNNEEYMYEVDIKFNNFIGVTELGKLAHRTEGSPDTNRSATLPVVIAQDGDLKIVDYNYTSGTTDLSTIATVTRLEKNKWYNFKFHIKPYIPEGTAKLNNGFVADVYFMDKLIAEDVVFATHKGKTNNVTNTDPTLFHAMTQIRHITFYAGTCTDTVNPRLVYMDNVKYYKVNKVEKNLLNLVDVGVYNADGKLISSKYEVGENTFKAYVTSFSKQMGAGISVIAVRYDSDNFSRLADIDIVSANVTKTDELTEVTAKIDVDELKENERIKVMVVGSTDVLNPYIEPIVLMPNVPDAQ